MRVQATLYGSLGATGRGHGSDIAVILGLAGERPEDLDTTTVGTRIEEVRSSGRLRLGTGREIDFDVDTDGVLLGRTVLPRHPNGMIFEAFDGEGELLERS